MGNTRPGAVRHSSAHSLMSTSKGSMPPMPPPLPPPLPPPTSAAASGGSRVRVDIQGRCSRVRVGARAREQRRLQDHVCREQVAGGPTGIVLRLVFKGRVVSSKSCLPFLAASRMPGKRHTTNAKHVAGQLRHPRGETSTTCDAGDEVGAARSAAQLSAPRRPREGSAGAIRRGA